MTALGLLLLIGTAAAAETTVVTLTEGTPLAVPGGGATVPRYEFVGSGPQWNTDMNAFGGLNGGALGGIVVAPGERLDVRSQLGNAGGRGGCLGRRARRRARISSKLREGERVVPLGSKQLGARRGRAAPDQLVATR